MHRTLLLVPVLLAAGLLAACGSDTGSDGAPATPGSGSKPGATVPTPSGDPDPYGDGLTLADGDLTLRVDGGRVVLSATTPDPAVVLADLSLAVTTPSTGRWDVLVTRPLGPRSDQADLPDTYDGVVTGPGEPTEVGTFELGPRPPEDLTLCIEVVRLPADQAGAEPGATLLLPPGDDAADRRHLCATTAID